VFRLRRLKNIYGVNQIFANGNLMLDFSGIKAAMYVPSAEGFIITKTGNTSS
jgi:hypothetical protein